MENENIWNKWCQGKLQLWWNLKKGNKGEKKKLNEQKKIIKEAKEKLNKLLKMKSKEYK